MRRLTTLIVSITFASFVAAAPVWSPTGNAAANGNGDVHIFGDNSSSSESSVSSNLAMASSVNTRLLADLEGTVLVLSDICNSPHGASGNSLDALIALSSNLLTATTADSVSSLILSLNAEAHALLSGSSNAVPSSNLTALLKALASLQASLDGQGSLDLNTVLAGPGGSVAKLLHTLGLDISFGSTPAVPVNSSTSVTGDIASELVSVVTILLSLGNGSIAVPSDVSFTTVAHLTSSLLASTSNPAVLDALTALNIELKGVIAATGIGELNAELTSLVELISVLNTSLDADGLLELDIELAAAGGTLSALLQSWGIAHVSPIPTSSPNHPKPGDTLDIDGSLKTIALLLVDVVDGNFTLHAGASLDLFFNITTRFLSCTSANAVLQALENLDVQVNALLQASVAGQLQTVLNSIVTSLGNLQLALAGAGALELDTELGAVDGTIASLLIALGVDLGSVAPPNTPPSSIPSPIPPTIGLGNLTLDGGLLTDLSAVLSLVAAVGSENLTVPAGVSLNTLTDLTAQLLAASDANTLIMVLGALGVEAKGLLTALSDCGCHLPAELEALFKASGALQIALGGDLSGSLDVALQVVGGTVQNLASALGIGVSLPPTEQPPASPSPSPGHTALPIDPNLQTQLKLVLTTSISLLTQIKASFSAQMKDLAVSVYSALTSATDVALVSALKTALNAATSFDLQAQTSTTSDLVAELTSLTQFVASHSVVPGGVSGEEHDIDLGLSSQDLAQLRSATTTLLSANVQKRGFRVTEGLYDSCENDEWVELVMTP
ncbi:hypothetical protein DL96DRAFT_1559175 [Flagelloscypha sp. PMI_526]|nr:hypothetical protein DL96DRAFT_1559175 [Flagelloscypha sp. PMI_526]